MPKLGYVTLCRYPPDTDITCMLVSLQTPEGGDICGDRRDVTGEGKPGAGAAGRGVITQSDTPPTGDRGNDGRQHTQHDRQIPDPGGESL